MEENKKNNKKKIIIIASVIAGIVLTGLIAFGVIKLIEGGKKIADEVDRFAENIEDNTPVIDLGDKIDEIVSNVSDEEEETEETTKPVIEETTEDATEKVTEEATEETTEEVTEAPTETPTTPQIDYANVDWWAIMGQVMEAGNYEDIDWSLILDAMVRSEGKDESDREIILNEYKKADNFDSIDWNAKDTSFVGPSFGEEVVITSPQPTTQAPLSEEEKLAQELKWDKGSFGKDYYQDENKTMYLHRSKDDVVMQTKNAWIKENFGTSFTYNGYEFGWDETNQIYYWIYKYGNIHYMTSTSTSILGQYYRNFYSYRIADYLGFYGTDYVGYHNEEALNDEIIMWSNVEEKMTVENPEANNVAYLKQLGWTEVVEDDGIDRWWEYTTPEGIGAYVYEDGYINIYVRYPEDTKENLCKFTIEEYNDLINNTNWTVHSQSGKFGWAGEDQSEWEPFIKKYVVIS